MLCYCFLLYCIVLYCLYSSAGNSILFCSILCHSIPFHAMPFYAIPFHAMPFHSMPCNRILQVINENAIKQRLTKMEKQNRRNIEAEVEGSDRRDERDTVTTNGSLPLTPPSKARTSSKKPKLKKWNILAVHTLPTR